MHNHTHMACSVCIVSGIVCVLAYIVSYVCVCSVFLAMWYVSMRVHSVFLVSMCVCILMIARRV